MEKIKYIESGREVKFDKQKNILSNKLMSGESQRKFVGETLAPYLAWGELPVEFLIKREIKNDIAVELSYISITNDLMYNFYKRSDKGKKRDLIKSVRLSEVDWIGKGGDVLGAAEKAIAKNRKEKLGNSPKLDCKFG